jgi:hypothetical protein
MRSQSGVPSRLLRAFGPWAAGFMHFAGQFFVSAHSVLRSIGSYDKRCWGYFGERYVKSFDRAELQLSVPEVTFVDAFVYDDA